MHRISVSLRPEVFEKLRARAAAEHRSISSYVQLLIAAHISPSSRALSTPLAEVAALGGDPEQILRAAIPTLAAPAASAPSA